MEVLQPASSLNYNRIRNTWYYASPGRSKPAIRVSNVPRNGSVLLHVDNLHPISNKTQKKTKINTLEEWLDKFIGTSSRTEYFKYLKLLWLDVKVPLDRYVFYYPRHRSLSTNFLIHIQIIKSTNFLYIFSLDYVPSYMSLQY